MTGWAVWGWQKGLGGSAGGGRQDDEDSILTHAPAPRGPYAPVISATREKNASLNGVLMPQFTGGVW